MIHKDVERVLVYSVPYIWHGQFTPKFYFTFGHILEIKKILLYSNCNILYNVLHTSFTT